MRADQCFSKFKSGRVRREHLQSGVMSRMLAQTEFRGEMKMCQMCRASFRTLGRGGSARQGKLFHASEQAVERATGADGEDIASRIISGMADRGVAVREVRNVRSEAQESGASARSRAMAPPEGFESFIGEDDAGNSWHFLIPVSPQDLIASVQVAAICDLVRARLRVAVPTWEHHTKEWIAWMVPKEWNPVSYDAPAANAASETSGLDVALAHFLQDLHRIDVSEALQFGVVSGTFDRLRAGAARTLLSVKREGAISLDDSSHLMGWLNEDAFWTHRPLLTHGKLGAESLWLDSGGDLVAVDGWWKAAVTDPAIDFANVRAQWGGQFFQHVVENYGVVEGVESKRFEEHVQNWEHYRSVVAAME